MKDTKWSALQIIARHDAMPHRSDVSDDGLVLVDAMPSDPQEQESTASRLFRRDPPKCRPKTTVGASRRLRDRSEPLPHRDGRHRVDGDLAGLGSVLDAYAADAGFEVDARRGDDANSRDDDPPFSLWDGAGRRPQYLDDDVEQPASYQGEVHVFSAKLDWKEYAILVAA